MGQRVWSRMRWGEYLLRRHNGVSASESLCEGWYYGAGYLFGEEEEYSGIGVIGLW